jgi:hypothetical protein
MEKFSLARYKREVAAYIREKQAHMARGQLPALQALESRSDDELLQRWAWTSAISGAIFSFLFAPLALSLLHNLVPYLLVKLLWAVTQVCMGLTLLMFGVAVYFTMYNRAR